MAVSNVNLVSHILHPFLNSVAMCIANRLCGGPQAPTFVQRRQYSN